MLVHLIVKEKGILKLKLKLVLLKLIKKEAKGY